MGAGVTPVVASSSFDSDNFSTTFGHVLFGYPMQPKDGITFRALYLQCCLVNLGLSISVEYLLDTNSVVGKKKIN
ncbi:MAG: hypothetical protein IPL04_17730 [Chitinophagaceae bacterium]|nr:hypothetical protein [Chitinophagaceae bacterium]